MTGPRTEHVGSLLRPPRLLEARRRFAAGQLDVGALRAAEDDAIVEALERQRETGIAVVGDGEFRRTDFRAGLARAVSGLRESAYQRSWRRCGGGAAIASRVWEVVARVRRAAPIAIEEARFIAAHADRPFKVTLPSPGYVAERFHAASDASPYASTAELASDLTQILRAEIEELICAGVPYIQLDNPGYATFLDADARSRLAEQGRDPERTFGDMLAADVALLESIPPERAILALHVCRGNNASQWLHQGSYEPIAEQLFGSLPVDRLLLEFDDERSGAFDVLRFVAPGVVAVLGLISSKVATIESPEALMRRLDDAARFIEPGQLAISPQCGFATHAEGANHLSIDDQYRKLAVAAQTADRWFRG